MISENGVLQLRQPKVTSKPGPVLQVRTIKQLSDIVICLTLGDGRHKIQAILQSNLCSLFTSKKLVEKSIIRVTDWIIKTLENKNNKVLLLSGLEVLTKHDKLIGSATPMNVEVQDNFPEENRPPVYTNPTAAKQPQTSYVGIDMLSLSSKDWTIKARVTKKQPIVTWNNFRGSGQLFNVILMDSTGKEIQGTFFKESVRMFYDLLEEGGVYSFSKGLVKPTNPRFTTISNEFQLTFDSRAEIQRLQDDPSISIINFEPIKIVELQQAEVNTLVDILGIVSEIGEVVSFTSKKGVPMMKRNITLFDDSFHSVGVTLWNEIGESFQAEIGQVIGLKSLRVSTFSGISLGTDRSGTSILYSPDKTLVNPLKQWQSINQDPIITALTETRTGNTKATLYNIHQLHKEWREKESGSALVKIIGMINYIKKDEVDSIIYPSCQNEKCKKKVQQTTAGFYYCENCQQGSENCDYRFMLNAKIYDSSDAIWVTCFDDVAQELLGIPAGELRNQMLSGELQGNIGENVLYQQRVFILKLQVMDTGMGPRLRSSVFRSYLLESQAQSILTDFLDFFKSQGS